MRLGLGETWHRLTNLDIEMDPCRYRWGLERIKEVGGRFGRAGVRVLRGYSPATLQYLVAEDDADAGIRQNARDDERLEEVVPPVAAGFAKRNLSPSDDDGLSRADEEKGQNR